MDNPLIELLKLSLFVDKNKTYRLDGKPPQPIDLFEIQTKLGPKGYHSELINNYHNCNEFYLKWYSKDHNLGHNTGGNIRFSSIDQLMGNEQGILYDRSTPKDDPIRDFHVVDTMAEDEMVGVYAGKNATSSLYYVEVDEPEPAPLYLDLVGYMEMLLISKGFYNWQNAVMEYVSGEEGEYTERMKKYMPLLFEGWTWEGFIQKFEEVRLRSV